VDTDADSDTGQTGDCGVSPDYTILTSGSPPSTVQADTTTSDYFIIAPDGKIASIELDRVGNDKCDKIVELDTSGNQTIIYTIRDDFGSLATQREWCHSNHIHYVPHQDAYYLSVLNQSMIMKINRNNGNGQVEWVICGQGSSGQVSGVTYLTGGPTWGKQHGHHTLKLQHGQKVALRRTGALVDCAAIFPNKKNTPSRKN
jgi:hypothetical protein